MRNSLFYSFIGLFFLVSACKKKDIEPKSNNSINKIMPLGASRVEGGKPDFESYRYELWKRLSDGGWEFDFIGTLEDESSYANHAGKIFDADHEGRGGWTSSQILKGISTWLGALTPLDIVLFSSPGGNDALNNEPYDQAVANINAIIDAIQAANPNVTVIIEQIAPAHSDAMTPTLTTYFMQMQAEVVNIAEAQTTETSRVLTVDMATGFTDALLADDVHNNDAGANFIPELYYTVPGDLLKK